MLTESAVAPTLPVVDLGRARGFYESVLGLKVNRATDEDVMYDCGDGTMLFLYKRPETSTEHTEASFKVDDIEKEVEELRGKGVVFEDFDMPGLKTENGIAAISGMRSAWFKDPDGNILALAQM
jgi:catechol 2,3-dioxygenase-like lactoylglutathione lyase family enzyme